MVDKGEVRPGEVFREMAWGQAGTAGRINIIHLPSPTAVLGRWWTERKEAGARHPVKEHHSPVKGIKRLM
jgi:hypothetical protein